MTAGPNVDATAVALLTLAEEAISLDRDQSHDLLTAMIEELDLAEAHLVVNELLIQLLVMTRLAGRDVEQLLARAGLDAARVST